MSAFAAIEPFASIQREMARHRAPPFVAGAADEIEAAHLEESLASAEMRLGHLLAAREHRADDQTADEAAGLDRLIALAETRRTKILRALAGA